MTKAHFDHATVDEVTHYEETGQLFPVGQTNRYPEDAATYTNSAGDVVECFKNEILEGREPQLEQQHEIKMVWPRDPEDGCSVVCSCDWVEGPSTFLIELAVEAKKHAVETGHQLRKH